MIRRAIIAFALFVQQVVHVVAADIGEEKIVINVDINKTIIALDTAQNKDVPTTINEILADGTYHKWDSSKEQSYANFVMDNIARTHPNLPRGSDQMKKKKHAIIEQFPKYLTEFHPDLYRQYKENFNKMIEILSHQEMVIFPSFYKFITWLETEHAGKYSIYLRTFGKDLAEVINLLESRSTLKFTAFGKRDQDTFIIEGSSKQAIPMTELIFMPGHYGIQDDYNFWKENQFQAKGGKLFIIGDKTTIFFDDNADGTADNRWIISPMKDGVLQDTLKLIEQGLIVPVNTKDAIVDENYFIDKVKVIFE